IEGEGVVPRELRAAAPPLKTALKDQDKFVQLYAARALWIIEHELPTVMPVLRPLLNDPEAGLRRDAADALADIGPRAKDAIADLKERLRKDDDMLVRLHMAQALWIIEEQADAVLPALRAGLLDNDAELRALAMVILARLKGKAKPAVEELVKI